MAKAKPKPDDEKQSERFIEKAKEVVGDNADDEFERVLKTTLPSKKKRSQTADGSR